MPSGGQTPEETVEEGRGCSVVAGSGSVVGSTGTAVVVGSVTGSVVGSKVGSPVEGPSVGASVVVSVGRGSVGPVPGSGSRVPPAQSVTLKSKSQLGGSKPGLKKRPPGQSEAIGTPLLQR